MRGPIVAACALVGCAIAAATTYGHYDHPAPSYAPPSEPASALFTAGGENAEWELIATIPTGNPHSDLDYFTSGGETYASVGTLGTGPNSGGQTIIRLTEKGEVKPSYVAGHPSASCLSASSSVTGLQHDVEATPKGAAQIPAQPNPFLDRRDAQLLIDATDAPGRCHDQGPFGAAQTNMVPQGGLEIVDVTDPARPKELALTSHIGQAHTVNVDPKRPHIAFDVTQDGVAIDAEGRRANETSGNQLDGFELIDLSSCMDFPAGTAIEVKRERCRPQVYRYRYPSVAVSKSHTYASMQSCHEVEIYPDDTLACASITATALFSLAGAFDDNGTPNDYTDDRPRGTPLPCRVRESSTAAGEFRTGAMITDCVTGTVNGADQSLTVAEWLKLGAPSLEGVRWLGTIPHMGFGATQDIVNTPYDATVDIVAAHETEISESGQFVITSDERGGGTVPGGATCSPGVDNVRGNGGLHFFPRRNFTTSPPGNAQDAQKLWAKTSDGQRAIFRAPTRTHPQGAFCTAHVFQLIPGQNRIFMGWYTQGTQVVDFTENGDGTVDFKNVAYFTPENANTWVSAIFRVERQPDGRMTYYGTTGDGILPGTGRSAIDVYKVTLPAPPTPAGGARPGGGDVSPAVAAGPCARTSAFGRVRARARGRRLRLSFTGGGRATIDLLRGRRRVSRLGNRRGGATLQARRLRPGTYVVRFRKRAPDGSLDVRRIGVRYAGGRFRVLADFEARRPCGLVDAFRLAGPTFGSRLTGDFRLGETARVGIEVRRGSRVVRRVRTRMYAAGRRHRFRLAGLARGGYTVTLKAQRPGRAVTVTLRARRV